MCTVVTHTYFSILLKADRQNQGGARFGEMDQLTEPVWCDVPFEKEMPLPASVTSNPCFCCLKGMMQVPKVRGIPTGSVALPEQEAKDLQAQLQGNWKIVPLQALNARSVVYEEVLVRDDYYIMQGGTRQQRVKRGDHWHTQTVPNTPSPPQKLKFMRGPAQEIYCDWAGSMITKMDIAGGEMEFNNALGISTLWQRGWKKDGYGPQQQQMGGTPAGPIVVEAQVVGASPVIATPVA